MSELKKKTIEHWTAVPIGTQTTGFATNQGMFTREYFEEHSRFRYVVYAPWLPSVAGFDAYHGKLLLEVGCGMGTDLLEYTRSGANVIGLDLTPRHLELAKRRFQLFGQHGTFINGDAEQLSFRDDSFDFVFSNGVLHHTPDTQRAVDEIHRVLRPGGEALIVLYHRHSLHYYLRILLESGSKRFVRHLLDGKKPSDFSYAKVLSSSTDGELNPLTKVYSRRQGAALMRRFSDVRTQIRHLNRGDFPLSRLFPSFLLRSLAHSVGWYLVLRGRKEHRQ
jgi:ubiquinone/menaquinone biosynthesis C-methylase UbiE